MATFERLQDRVQASVKEVEVALALTSLSRKFSEDERIAALYDDTYEARGFAMCRSSVDSCLVLSLTRCHDHRRDSHGLTAFFDVLRDDETQANLREGILQMRLQWVNEAEAQQDAEERMGSVEAARKLEVTLKGSHQYNRVKTFRHTHIAHRALDTEHVRPTEREFLYELTDRSTEVVQMLSGAVLGAAQGFTQHAEIWDEYYAGRFFSTMMERSAN